MNKKFIQFDGEDSVTKYFKDIKKTSLLTQEEEILLAKRIQLGDQDAIDKLVTSNLKFVISIAKEYQGQGLPLSDLINEGNYGLLKAATKFDYNKGFRFISYAVWWVKQSILESLNENARTVRLPANVINKISYLNKEIAKFEKDNEREPVFGEIFDKNNEVAVLLTYPRCSSLNDVINEDGDEMVDLLVSDDTTNNELVIDARIKDGLNKVLDILDERERDIIESYFGLNKEHDGMTLEAIGEKYGLTKERIRQIKFKALRKIRHNAENLYALINE